MATQVQQFDCWNCCDTCKCPGRPNKLFATFSSGFLPTISTPFGVSCNPCAAGTIELNYKFGAPTHFLPSYTLYGWPPIPPSPPAHISDSMSSSTVARLYEFYVGDGVDVSGYPTIGSCNMYYYNPELDSWIIPDPPYNVARVRYVRLFCTKNTVYYNPLSTWQIVMELATVGWMGGLVEKPLTLYQYLGQMPLEYCNPVFFEKYMYRAQGAAEYDMFIPFKRSLICYKDPGVGLGINDEFINFKVAITE